MLDLDDWPVSSLQPFYNAIVRGRRHQRLSTSRPPPNHRITRMDRMEDYFEQPLRGQLKRRRALEDIEGDNTCSVQRKKRRLRHSFCTSRLSEPYAIPATYIPSRKTLKKGLWARQRVAGRNLLRKAAALNSFSKKRKDSQIATRRPRSIHNSPVASTKPSRSKSRSPRRSSPPLSPKSSSFSEFYIFDFEDDTSQEDDSEWDKPDAINSDFSKIQEADWDVVQEYGFDSSSTLESDDIYTLDPGGREKAIGLIVENERQNEVSWAPGVT